MFNRSKVSQYVVGECKCDGGRKSPQTLCLLAQQLALELLNKEAMARVPDTEMRVSPQKVILNMESVGLTNDQFVQLCRDNPDLRLEFTAQKEIVIMPPNWTKTGMQNAEISSQLWVWAKADGMGVVGDSSTGFTLPSGAVRSPDASWVRRERWDALTEAQQNSFAPLCPDFVIE